MQVVWQTTFQHFKSLLKFSFKLILQPNLIYVIINALDWDVDSL